MQAYSFEHHGMRLTHASSHEMGKEHFLPLLAPSQFYALVRFGLISEQVRIDGDISIYAMDHVMDTCYYSSLLHVPSLSLGHDLCHLYRHLVN